MEANDTELSPTKAKTKKLKAKVKDLRNRLKTAHAHIETLEKENRNLQNAASNLEVELRALKSQVEVHKEENADCAKLFDRSKLVGASASSRALSSHPIRLVPIVHSHHQPIAGSTDSSSSFVAGKSYQKVEEKQVQNQRPPSPSLSSSEASEGQKSKEKTRVNNRVRFRDDVVEVGRHKPPHKPRAAPSPLKIIPTPASSSDFAISDSNDHDSIPTPTYFAHADQTRSNTIIERMKEGNILEEAEITQFANFFLERDPATLAYIESQKFRISASHSNLSSPSSLNTSASFGAGGTSSRKTSEFTLSTPPSHQTPSMRYESNESPSTSTSSSNSIHSPQPQDSPRQSWIGFSGPLPSPTEIHASPFPAFTEQVFKTRLVNLTQSDITLFVYTFASPGAFLGFSISRTKMRNFGDDSRLALTWVGTAMQKDLSALAIVIAVSSANNCSDNIALQGMERGNTDESTFSPKADFSAQNSKTNIGNKCAQYYLFASTVDSSASHNDSKHENEKVWKVNLTLMNESSSALSSSPLSSVCHATLLGASVTSRIFKRQASLSDIAYYERNLKIFAKLPVHPNIASVIGVSDKRPFRVISQHWSCTLSTSLMLTCMINGGEKNSPQFASKNRDIASKNRDMGLQPFSAFKLLESYGKANSRTRTMISMSSPTKSNSRTSMSPISGGLPCFSSSDLKSRLVIAQDVLNSVSLIHSCHFVHRDLGTGSFGMVSEDFAILADYISLAEVKSALPSQLQTSSSSSSTSSSIPKLVITHRWIAPELTSALHASGTPHYTVETDIYAIGVILMDLVVGAPLSTALGAFDLATFDFVFKQWSASVFHEGELERDLEFAKEAFRAAEDAREEPIRKLVRLVSFCTHPTPSMRPTIPIISKVINSIICQLDSDPQMHSDT